ncbi:AEC family transporter [Kribbella sp. HUAS MG21]|uniref:AEC family transporter n=1 Tax=Kribbella sp. HUAS MG21 TaxID=3160966 RepID=A0AAU7TDW0_9ACTN
MSAVIGAFAALVAVAVLGYVIGLFGVLRKQDELVLSRLAFFVATPALLFTTVAKADLGTIFSVVLVTNLVSLFVVQVVFLVAVLIWRRTRSQAAIGVLASSYVNAGNLGVPVAAYVLGDGALVAPIVLFQVLIMAPIAFAVLDSDRLGTGRRVSLRTVVTRPLRNPLTVASLLGLLVSLLGVRLPDLLMRPIELVAAAAVPVALVAYGLSLSAGTKDSITLRRDVVLAVALKTFVQPLAAYAIARWVLDLHGPALLAPTLLAALPTAQNVYVYAVHYRASRTLARSAVLLSTLLSIPVMILIAGLLT